MHTLMRLKFERVRVRDCFAGSEAAVSADGGALYSIGGAGVELTNSSIESSGLYGSRRVRGTAVCILLSNDQSSGGSNHAFLRNVSIWGCYANSPEALGTIYASQAGVQVELRNSTIAESSALMGGGCYLGSEVVAVFTQLLIRDTRAISGAAFYMEDASKLQGTDVEIRHRCTDNATGSLLRLSTTGRLPLRGLQVSTTECSASMALIEGDGVGRTPRCSDSTYEDLLR